MTKIRKSDEEKIIKYWNDEDDSELTWDLIKCLPPDARKDIDNRAIRDLAFERQVSEEQMREDLGESKLGYASIWGGKLGKLFMQYALDEINRRLEEYKDKLYKKICEEFQYCKKRKEKKFQNEGYLLAVLIADSMLSIAVHFPFPVTATAVYIIKHKILDKWCQCDDSTG